MIDHRGAKLGQPGGYLDRVLGVSRRMSFVVVGPGRSDKTDFPLAALKPAPSDVRNQRLGSEERDGGLDVEARGGPVVALEC
jgi:hypothetical protein